MNVNELVRRVLGRRIALAIVVAVACVAGVYGYTQGVTVWQSTAAAVVIPPPTFSSTGDTLGANPVLNLSAENAQLAAVVSTAMMSEPAQSAVATVAPGVKYLVSSVADLGPSNFQPSPQLTITVRCSAPADCQTAGKALIDFARDALVKLQIGATVAPENWASLTVLQDPTTPEAISNNAVKSGGSMAIAALLAGAILLLGYDALAARRRNNPRSPKAPAPAKPRREPTPALISSEPAADELVTSEPEVNEPDISNAESEASEPVTSDAEPDTSDTAVSDTAVSASITNASVTIEPDTTEPETSEPATGKTVSNESDEEPDPGTSSSGPPINGAAAHFVYLDTSGPRAWPPPLPPISAIDFGGSEAEDASTRRTETTDEPTPPADTNRRPVGLANLRHWLRASHDEPNSD